MINIVDAVSIKLKALYPAGYEIYADETVKQGLIEPCFYISVIEESQEKQFGLTYLRTVDMDIVYFPQNPGDNEEMMTVAEQMFELENITLTNGDKLRGSGMHYQIVDEVLHFFISYRIRLRVSVSHDNMESLTFDSSVIS